jgi:hypothetical protein
MTFQKNLPILLITALLGGAIGAAVGYGVLLRYKSYSLISWDMRPADYRVFQESVNNLINADRYATVVAKDPSRLEAFSAVRSEIVRQTRWFEPVQRLSKQDTKEFAESGKALESNDIIGLRFTATSSSAEAAQRNVIAKVEYATDASLRSALIESLRSQKASKRTQLDRANSEKLRNEYEIATLQGRLKEFKRIALAYPETNRVDMRQLMNIDKGGERFMPIPSQMAAFEAQIVDLNEQINRSQRDAKKYPLELQMFDSGFDLAGKNASGKVLADALIKSISAQLASANDDWAKQAYLDQLNIINDLRTRYVDKVGFIAEPSLPTRPEQPTPLVLAFLGAILFTGATAAWLYRANLRKWLIESNEQPALAAQ